MAHGITATDKTITFVDTKGKAAGAWHGLDTPFTEHFDNMTDAMEFAGQAWEVEVVPNYINIGGELVVVPGARTVIRGDNKAILGNVGPKWTPLQNRDAFNWFQPFLDKGLAKLETAGSLHGGELVWVLAQICGQDGDIVAGDQYSNRILLTNAHDGEHAIRVGFTPIRVVCQNTVSMAWNSCASKLIRVRHSANVKQNVDNIREVMDTANFEFRASLEQLAKLSTKGISRADLRKYVKTTLGKLANMTPAKIDELVKDDTKMSTRFGNLVEAALGHIENSPGAEFAKGTWYQAAQGLNYYANYEFGNTQENRLTNLWFGKNANLPFEVAFQMAG